jgi:hypothetical protein
MLWALCDCDVAPILHVHENPPPAHPGSAEAAGWRTQWREATPEERAAWNSPPSAP